MWNIVLYGFGYVWVTTDPFLDARPSSQDSCAFGVSWMAKWVSNKGINMDLISKVRGKYYIICKYLGQTWMGGYPKQYGRGVGSQCSRYKQQ